MPRANHHFLKSHVGFSVIHCDAFAIGTMRPELDLRLGDTLTRQGSQ